ncbi:dihydrolipoyl dehydrogenase family protein [Nitrosophilus kaiyonis]|uniref:dihydrolipoyl dehydrogenase family protein n=1 Tax=Nitrosophilus kaiyonis TaxID=2930200 RepID=UPI0024910FA7|nr:NAD(P)/FAD-dependent oxidoreductase [Nitrosophilus kaiyonis]
MYDIIFIGGGLNYAGAVVAAKKGLKVALIEKDLFHLGGTCLHEGCIPSKYLLHLADINCELKNEAFRIKNDKIKLEIAQKHIDEVLRKSTKSIKIQCSSTGVELIEGEGYLIDKKQVQIDKDIYEAKYIVIGTGSHPFIPDGIEYNKESIVTSDEILKLKNFPKNIAIYGSGAIGLEFASFFAANRVDVTLIYRHEHISNKIHPQIIQKIEENLKKLGVKLMPNTTILEARDFEKSARVTTNEGVFDFEKLLVATGRVPNIDVIKTDLIKTSKGVVTDDFFETSLKNHFAIGDCNAKLMLAHAARAQVLNVVENITGNKKILNLMNIPKFIYTLPLQYAAVGLTKTYLDKNSIHYKESLFPLKALAISHLLDTTEGVVILYADENDFIIGAELFMPNAQELIGIISTALNAELDKNSFLETVFAHPTFSESIDRVVRRL